MLKNNKKRAWLTAGLGFFLSITLLITVVCVELRLGICSTVSLRRSVKESFYAEHAYKEFTGRAEQLLQSHGIRIDSQTLFPEKDLKYAFSNYEDCIYGQKKKKDYKTKIVTDVEQAVQNYLIENQVELTGTMEQGIRRNSEAVGELYSQYMEPDFIEEFNSMANKNRDILKILMIVFAILSIALIVILLSVFHHKHKAIRYIFSGTLAAAMMNILGIVVAARSVNIKELGIASSAYTEFLEHYKSDVLIPSYIGSAVLILSCGLLFYLLKWMRQRR